MCRGFIQRPTKRVICARLSPVTFTRNRCTIPFCPLLNLRYRCLFSVPSIKPYASPALFRRAVDLPVPLAELLHFGQTQSLQILHSNVHLPAACNFRRPFFSPGFSGSFCIGQFFRQHRRSQGCYSQMIPTDEQAVSTKPRRNCHPHPARRR